jgi:hypothetical protein
MIYDSTTQVFAKVIDRATGRDLQEVTWVDTDRGEYAQLWRDASGCLVFGKDMQPIRRKRRGQVIVFLQGVMD